MDDKSAPRRYKLFTLSGTMAHSTHASDETIRVIRAERQFALAPDGATCVEKSLRQFV
ncbi:MAG: hypothetical protein WAQ05_24465 [Rubrivivax sp.]